MELQENLISQILSKPDVSYKPKKREYQDRENATDISPKAEKPAEITLSDLVDKFKHTKFLGDYAEKLLDTVCADLTVVVNRVDNPFVYEALVYLFGDDFKGIMTYEMYSQLISIKQKIYDHNIRKASDG